MTDNLFEAWLESLERRHLADLQFSEVTRALRSLSADYVQRRSSGRSSAAVRGSALEGRGKRAAFALFYGPLHFLVVARIVAALGVRLRADRLVDLGCGTGAAGAALAIAAGGVTEIVGVDRERWALREAELTYRHFSLRCRTVHASVQRARIPRGAAVLAAYAINELDDAGRTRLQETLTSAVRAGSALLVVEPIARTVAPWWRAWDSAFRPFGARSDEWRFSDPLPERVRAFDKAAGLDHREQTARSLWVPESLS